MYRIIRRTFWMILKIVHTAEVFVLSLSSSLVPYCSHRKKFAKRDYPAASGNSSRVESMLSGK
jgi:hypothetical protein